MSELIVRFNEAQFILGQWRWVVFLAFWWGCFVLNLTFRTAGKTGSDKWYVGINWPRMILLALLFAVVFFRLLIF